MNATSSEAQPASAGRSKSPARVLIAGVGNLLRGDDGFGVEALRHLYAELGEVPGVRYFESGIAGISLAQELVDGFDCLILLDAVDRGAKAGTVFVLELDLDAAVAPAAPGEGVDLHQADPEGVLRLAAALGALPRQAWMVGCQVGDCDEFGAGLGEPVRGALPATTRRVRSLLADLDLLAPSSRSCDGGA